MTGQHEISTGRKQQQEEEPSKHTSLHHRHICYCNRLYNIYHPPMALCNSCDLVCLRVGLMLLAAGSSSDFQTGLSTQEDQHTFQPCSSDLLRSSQVFAVAAGALHTLFFTTSTSNNTQVIGCGDNSRGQLLAGSQRVLPDPSILPISYPQDYSPAHVHASWQTSYFHLTSTNPSKSDILLSCGSNDFGELGTGSTGSYELAPKAVQLEVAWPHPDPFIIEKVSAGPRHVLALLASKLQSERKQLVGWGAARKGELGQSFPNRCLWSLGLMWYR